MLTHTPMIAGRASTQSGSHAAPPPRRPRPLEDEELRDEIELLFDVIVTVADYPKHLTSQQVDAALQLAWGRAAGESVR